MKVKPFSKDLLFINGLPEIIFIYHFVDIPQIAILFL